VNLCAAAVMVIGVDIQALKFGQTTRV